MKEEEGSGDNGNNNKKEKPKKSFAAKERQKGGRTRADGQPEPEPWHQLLLLCRKSGAGRSANHKYCSLGFHSHYSTNRMHRLTWYVFPHLIQTCSIFVTFLFYIYVLVYLPQAIPVPTIFLVRKCCG